MVSVLILSYNQEDTIEQTLQSILQQKGDFPIELVLGDDGSTDGTLARIKAICDLHEDARFTYVFIDNVTNVGLVENYKRCIRLASYDFVAVCAGDDYWIDANKLEKQVDYLQKNPEYKLVYTNFNILYHTTGKVISPNIKMVAGDIFEELLIENRIPALTVMVDKSILLEAIDKGYLNKGFAMEDYPVWLYIARKYKIGYIPDRTAMWRRHSGSISVPKSYEKQLRFDLSVNDVKWHFYAESNLQQPQLWQTIVTNYRRILDIACEQGFAELGKLAYAQLKAMKVITKKDRLKLFWLKNRLGYKIYLKLAQIKKS